MESFIYQSSFRFFLATNKCSVSFKSKSFKKGPICSSLHSCSMNYMNREHRKLKIFENILNIYGLISSMYRTTYIYIYINMIWCWRTLLTNNNHCNPFQLFMLVEENYIFGQTIYRQSCQHCKQAISVSCSGAKDISESYCIDLRARVCVNRILILLKFLL